MCSGASLAGTYLMQTATFIYTSIFHLAKKTPRELSIIASA
jgi:hypothetical protein